MDRNCAQLLMLFSHGHKLRETVGIDFKRAEIEQKRREIAKKRWVLISNGRINCVTAFFGKERSGGLDVSLAFRYFGDTEQML